MHQIIFFSPGLWLWRRLRISSLFTPDCPSVLVIWSVSQLWLVLPDINRLMLNNKPPVVKSQTTTNRWNWKKLLKNTVEKTLFLQCVYFTSLATSTGFFLINKIFLAVIGAKRGFFTVMIFCKLEISILNEPYPYLHFAIRSCYM